VINNNYFFERHFDTPIKIKFQCSALARFMLSRR
jgi:hypothetical protein